MTKFLKEIMMIKKRVKKSLIKGSKDKKNFANEYKYQYNLFTCFFLNK